MLLLAGLPADADRKGGDAPARAWRTLKRMPAQIGSATGRALREFEAGVEQGRRRGARPAPPELPAEEPPVEEPLFDSWPPEPEPAEPGPTDMSFAPSAPAPDQEASHPPVAPAERKGLHAAGAGALAAALAGAALAWRRHRRTAERDVATLPATTPAPDPAPPSPARERTTVPRAPAPPAAVEAAVADVLARDADDRPTPFPGAGRYELLEEIGRGGMGVVYRARDKRLDRIVALKRLPEDLQAQPRAVQLLLREARSAAQLNHPHIVTVYDVDHEDGAYFLTMEHLEGQPLSTLLRRRGRFSAAEVCWLGRQAAAGLAYAHERRIVHRDVKTANLFLTRDRVVKIMDFGLAKMMEAVRRRATRIGGTPDYMAPEQTLGLEVDGRADLYALGATLHELLTGAVLFEEGDAMRHQRVTPPPDPRERVPEVPAALAALVLQLLAKKPDDRPASAGEVVGRLRAIEGETPRG